MNLHENAAEFLSAFSVFVSINGIAISCPNASEARYLSDIENGSLHISANFRPATRDYSTFHMSCYAGLQARANDDYRITSLVMPIRPSGVSALDLIQGYMLRSNSQWGFTSSQLSLYIF
ncbi:hypothetical protein FGSG_13376 [Fusarium graminearum PH-1]|uniref:Chromosome 2, complete genome n=1 Tax=Gibberella zeae (strain ATCC MYA-4620 / CBS 123657 / FGSC 9075 / NRRL 31084 / PH-1) TaxID=229533 RepID=I1S946_GIBZE|nr:hypothetical protein FGSG_13376 [Fusarium graminearum PH-1]ESU14992.1 hypothetical protein FGSG_13376 [Fusarium graminearum PH-1]CEF76685.1 unnamed protein product [Fusarium graminearum]|eukprot:XP_011320417.1 hypothetical protein FGSG_13376 [Fusarium graminearum PH-1]